MPSGVVLGNFYIKEKLKKKLKNNMDEEIFELAKDNDLSLDEAEELQEFKEETVDSQEPFLQKLELFLLYCDIIVI